MKTNFHSVLYPSIVIIVSAFSSCDINDEIEHPTNMGSDTVIYHVSPKAFMFYNEFVPDGGTLKIKGEGFSASTQVFFQSKKGDPLPATDVKFINKGEIWATVPTGVAESSFVSFKNGDLGSECGIRFRDTRNVLVNFDTEDNLSYTYWTGAVAKALDGTYDVTANADIAENYSANAKNQYGLLTKEEDWQAISYAPYACGGDEFFEAGKNNVFGTFLADAKKNINDFVVKFELNVPDSGALDGMGIVLCFTSSADTTLGYCRQFAACFQPAEIVFDKTSDPTMWTIERYIPYTTDGWMTVTVPMSEFIWNLAQFSYLTAPNIVALNLEMPEELIRIYGDKAARSYAEVYADELDNIDGIYDYWGGLQLMVNPYDFGNGANGKTGTIAIDNVRIVPNDGNGAIYPKAGFGVPSQHYFQAPRTKVFK